MAGGDDERDYHGELTDWLRDKSEDVWFDSVGHIHWDANPRWGSLGQTSPPSSHH
jgi:hypothetical protein